MQLVKTGSSQDNHFKNCCFTKQRVRKVLLFCDLIAHTKPHWHNTVELQLVQVFMFNLIEIGLH